MMLRSDASCRADGFSLVEMLIVLAIVAVLFGMISSAFVRRDSRDADVKAAADELAAVLRSTRTRAMERQSTYVVTFNIQNTPDSSGYLLSNSGGHWYRVVGPMPTQLDWRNLPPFFNNQTSLRDGTNNATGNGDLWAPALRPYEELMERSWVGDKHVLRPNRVRFVALTDQDSGSFRRPGDTYPSTYPRPWFGWFDASVKRLYPWGGYDPTLAIPATRTGTADNTFRALTIAGHPASHTGFYYEGEDGIITGCRYPADRVVYGDRDDNTWVSTNTEDLTVNPYVIGKKGDPRPLINAVWQDYSLIIHPDGTVVSEWMRLRHVLAAINPEGNFSCVWPLPGGRHNPSEVGPADRCNWISQRDITGIDTNRDLHSSYGPGYPEATNYASRSGYYFITLGPNPSNDNGYYPDVATALSDLMPLYRVGISPFGDVCVVKVQNSKTAMPTFDSTITGSGWNTKATTDTYFAGQILTNTALPTSNPNRFPIPVSDLVTQGMLLNRQWWALP